MIGTKVDEDVVAGRVSGNNEHVVRRNTIRPLELDILALLDLSRGIDGKCSTDATEGEGRESDDRNECGEHFGYICTKSGWCFKALG